MNNVYSYIAIKQHRNSDIQGTPSSHATEGDGVVHEPSLIAAPTADAAIQAIKRAIDASGQNADEVQITVYTYPASIRGD